MPSAGPRNTPFNPVFLTGKLFSDPQLRAGGDWTRPESPRAADFLVSCEGPNAAQNAGRRVTVLATAWNPSRSVNAVERGGQFGIARRLSGQIRSGDPIVMLAQIEGTLKIDGDIALMVRVLDFGPDLLHPWNWQSIGRNQPVTAREPLIPWIGKHELSEVQSVDRTEATRIARYVTSPNHVAVKGRITGASTRDQEGLLRLKIIEQVIEPQQSPAANIQVKSVRVRELILQGELAASARRLDQRAPIIVTGKSEDVEDPTSPLMVSGLTFSNLAREWDFAPPGIPLVTQQSLEVSAAR